MTDRLDEIVERAFIDAYTIDEQAIGLAIVVTDGICPPFDASVVGVEVEVIDTAIRQVGMFDAPAVVCCRNGTDYVVDVLDLGDWQNADGADYIAAYRKHCGLEPWGVDRTDDESRS